MNRCIVFCVCLCGIVVESASLSFQDQIAKEVQNEVSNPEDITINIRMHFDQQLIEQMTKKYNKTSKERNFLRKIANVLMQDIQEMYKDQHLGVKIHFSHVTKFLRKNSVFSKDEEDATAYLKAYCKWQAEQKKKNGQKYYSVLLTGAELVEDASSPMLAYSNSHKGSMCTEDKSCTIQQWLPERIPYNLAAAIGHSLGMTSDVPAECEEKKSVMNLNFTPKEDKVYWNECNGKDLRNYLISTEAECLTQDDHDERDAYKIV